MKLFLSHFVSFYKYFSLGYHWISHWIQYKKIILNRYSLAVNLTRNYYIKVFKWKHVNQLSNAVRNLRFYIIKFLRLYASLNVKLLVVTENYKWLCLYNAVLWKTWLRYHKNDYIFFANSQILKVTIKLCCTWSFYRKFFNFSKINNKKN